MNYKGGKPKCVDCQEELTNYRPGGRCKSCWSIFVRGKNHPRWNGGIKPLKCQNCGVPIYRGQKQCWACYQLSNRGKNHHKYKKQPMSYTYLHKVIRPQVNLTECEHCGKKGIYISYKYNEEIRKRWSIELANKTGNYFRDKSDWLALCKSCHRNYDFKNKLYQTSARTKLS